MTDLGAYSGLFLSAFVAATLLPTASEAVLVGLLLAGNQPAEMLILVASVGNVLGSVVNWVLGRWIEHFKEKPWFPVKAASLAHAQAWYSRYGKWSLLLSWAPVIGDPLIGRGWRDARAFSGVPGAGDPGQGRALPDTRCHHTRLGLINKGYA